MKKLSLDIKLLLIFLLVLAGTVSNTLFNSHLVKYTYSDTMKKASLQAQEWFDIIKERKEKEEIISDAFSSVPNSFMIGNDWSDITTTLGSLEAKETSSNPDFAALAVRLFNEADIQKGDKVGVIFSGSFPSISISVLAALQVMELDAIIVSSIGASTYGANQIDATWLDMEHWLNLYGGMKYRSEIVSMGAGQDNGDGLMESGKSQIRLAAERNHVDLYIPENIEESIEYKTNIFLENEISILINVGGNMAAMGACSHALNIPNGLNTSVNSCNDADRGIIFRLNEKDIPFIHFLNIKEMASEYGIEVSPGISYAESTNLYSESNTNKFFTLIILILCVVSLVFLKKDL